MALTKEQYDSIIREYENRQTQNFHELNRRKEQIYKNIPEYKQLEDEIASASVARAKALIDGTENSADEYHRQITDINNRKKLLLKENHYPEDYLEPGYTCTDCKDTGYVDGEKCHCFKQMEITLLYEQSNIQEMIAKENFSTLSYQYYEGEDLVRFQNAVNICKNFVTGFDNNYQNLLFYGMVGTGKSFLSGCVAKELLLTGHSVIYFSANGLFESLSRYAFDTKSKEGLYNFYKDLYNCDLVIIDDLGTEVTNNFVASQLFSLLNERHLRQKSTIISTNLNLVEIKERYSERIFSRITSNYSICKLTGNDIRLQRKMAKTK